VQAFSWLDVARAAAPADLISISAHKFGGPKGVGALVVRNGVDLAPRVVGGGQERGRRSGTHNVGGIVAMATAARITAAERAATAERVTKLRDRLADGLVATVPDVVETGVARDAAGPDRSDRVAGICHLCIADVESEALLFLLEEGGVFASAASSCSSGALEASHVLAAIGVPPHLAAGSLRLSLGYASTDADVDLALEVLPPAVERLRLFSPRNT
jgi:cysteine desulfurase